MRRELGTVLAYPHPGSYRSDGRACSVLVYGQAGLNRSAAHGRSHGNLGVDPQVGGDASSGSIQ